MTMSAPAPASARAMAVPRRPVPPTTRATRSFRSMAPARLSREHRLGDARELLVHLGLRLHRRRPHEDTVRARVEEAPDQVAVGRLAVDRDADGGRVAAGVLGEPVERGAALLELIRRHAIRQPPVAPGHDALEDVLGAAPQEHRRVRLLRRLRVGADRREVVVRAVEFGLGFGPQLLHGEDRLSGLRPAVVEIAAHDLRLLPQPARTDAEEEPPAAEDRKSTRLNSSHSSISYAVFCLKKKKKKKNIYKQNKKIKYKNKHNT